MKTLTEDSKARIEQLTELGFAITHSAPTPRVNEDWPNIHFSITLHFKGRVILATDYSLGVGYVDVRQARPDSSFMNWTEDERSLLYTWGRKPSADFKDKNLQASVACKLAIKQKVTPRLDDVMHSLLLDGEAFFNAMTFEQWAAEYGYEADSRKAEKIFKACDLIGRQLASGVPAEAIATAREILREM